MRLVGPMRRNTCLCGTPGRPAESTAEMRAQFSALTVTLALETKRGYCFTKCLAIITPNSSAEENSFSRARTYTVLRIVSVGTTIELSPARNAALMSNPSTSACTLRERTCCMPHCSRITLTRRTRPLPWQFAPRETSESVMVAHDELSSGDADIETDRR
eukprot:Amastigsp_a176088_33.p3 type:complete len:160 gc:universal Amastigsp_a176088_33:473-952(+)